LTPITTWPLARNESAVKTPVFTVIAAFSLTMTWSTISSALVSTASWIVVMEHFVGHHCLLQSLQESQSVLLLKLPNQSIAKGW
jgi:hypothetical protein